MKLSVQKLQIRHNQFIVITDQYTQHNRKAMHASTIILLEITDRFWPSRKPFEGWLSIIVNHRFKYRTAILVV